ncbi:hypothetical protein KKB18_13035, partial [bacterium]|nr:hypothetical protein [bacterium]
TLELKKAGFKIYLETNTLNYENLEGVSEHLDIISADVKILHPDFEKKLMNSLLKFLRISTLNDIFLKIPVNSNLDLSLFESTIRKISSIRDKTTIVIQPLTEKLLPEPDRKFIEMLFYLQSFTLNYFDDVRIIPQIHKFMKIK